MSDEAPELFETVGPHEKSNAMPAPIVEKIRSYDSLNDDTVLPEESVLGDYTLPEMELPGFGGVKYDDCGEDLPHACKCCGSVVAVGRTCDSNTCERCAASWCRRRAAKWAAKIMQLKGYRYGTTGEDQHYHHITISPPDFWTVKDDDTRKAARAIVRTIMDELGVEGVAVYHPYRGADEEKPSEESHPVEKYDDEHDRDDDDRDDWAPRLFEGRDWEGDVRDELKFDPHFHVVGVGGFARGGELTKAVEDATGWVIHRITPDDPSKTYSIKDERGLARVLAYVHSHAGLRETEAGNKRVESTYASENLRNNENFEVAESTHDRAEQLVREEAWRVLGIPSATMTCHEDHLLPPDEDDEQQASGDGDGDDAGADGDEVREPCGGELVRIDAYDHEQDQLVWEDLLSDDEWREDARHDAEAARALAEWRQEQQPESTIYDVLTAG